MYGRARRIEFLKKVVITIVSVISILIVAKIVVSILLSTEEGLPFSELKKYLNGKGFVCETLTNSGAVCKYNTEGVTERFIRYEKGFDYLYNNKSYIIEIYHVDGEEKLLFSTGDNSFTNYKNIKYSCSYQENILNEIDECVAIDDSDIKLDNEAYKGIINKKIYEVNMIIEASGYDKEKLLKDYIWEIK